MAFISNISQTIDSGRRKPILLNPNQRQFIEDNRRYKEKLSKFAKDGNIIFNNKSNEETNLYMKPKELEMNVDLLDEHDSFYHTTKSLLFLFQIMGVMPIKRSPKTSINRTSFNWCSNVFMWAYFIYFCETIVVLYIGSERVKKFFNNPDKRFDEIIYNVIFISMLLPHLLLPIASWRSGHEVAKFKNMWTNYQLKFFRVTGTPIVFPNLFRLTYFLCFFSWTMSIAVMLSQCYLQDDFEFWQTLAYYHILAMLNGFCSLWFINCTAFGTASGALVNSLQTTLCNNTKPAKKLTEYRHLWVDLSHMMQQLGRAYSNMYGIYCLVIFFTTIIATFGAFSEILDHGATYKEIGLFIIVLYCMSLLFIICNEAHYASQKVGLEFQTRLLNVNLTAVDKATEKEVEMFLIAIAKNPPTMNLNEYANINRELITSNISFMATYLVVLLQFKLTLLRQSAKNLMLLNLQNMTINANISSLNESKAINI